MLKKINRLISEKYNDSFVVEEINEGWKTIFCDMTSILLAKDALTDERIDEFLNRINLVNKTKSKLASDPDYFEWLKGNSEFKEAYEKAKKYETEEPAN